ncbi:hypothetical protein RMAECT_0131 [Rickettsia rhipicephali str. Ect]|uniref:Uncharacterized protein n=2 Tax=spotted fever group TaxID=114277 RepID=A0A0F3PDL3_RICRH|nr:hypothetical protein RMB_02820 [Rickettsia massiliae str. AZT80]KJV78430.1 hypothetical protein RMAECT_0131 [Rickettsia rhipicephali str. Ect]
MIISKHIIRSSIYINKYILIVKNNSKLLAIYQIIKNFACSFVVQGYSMEMITGHRKEMHSIDVAIS